MYIAVHNVNLLVLSCADSVSELCGVEQHGTQSEQHEFRHFLNLI